MSDKSTKKLNTDILSGVQNAYDDLSDQITDVGDDVLDQPSAEAVKAGNDAIKATAGNTKDMLNSFDKYLGDVATAFADSDTKLSEDIKDPTPNTLDSIKSSDAYKKLME